VLLKVGYELYFVLAVVLCYFVALHAMPLQCAVSMARASSVEAVSSALSQRVLADVPDVTAAMLQQPERLHAISITSRLQHGIRSVFSIQYCHMVFNQPCA